MTTPADISLYDLLGVSPNASTNEVKKAYRKKAMQFHPDKNPGDSKAAQNFQEMAAAYEVLSNEETRAAYDLHGLDGLKNGGMGADAEAFAQFFNDSGFGFHFDFAGPSDRQQESSILPLEVTLEDLYLGKTVKMTVERETPCTSCKGSGCKGGSHKPHKCSKCEGKGWTHAATHLGNNMYGSSRLACSDCGGSGQVLREKDRCRKCKGKRTLTEKKRQDVVIEPGMSQGAKIVLKGEGDQMPGQQAEDVVFALKAVPHQSFERSGNDLLTTVHLTLSEALLGFSRVVVTHLDGRGLKVSSPKGKIIKPGDSIVLRGEGMPMYSSADKGDLFVLFDVEMPPESWLLSIDQSALEKLLPPKKPERVPNVTIVDEGRFELADISEFGEQEGDWVDEDDEEEDGDRECVPQ